METLNELLKKELTIGQQLRFVHSSAYMDKPSTNVSIKVRLKDEVFKAYVKELYDKQEEKLKILNEKADSLKPLFTTKKSCKEIIDIAKAEKKRLKIARWDKVKTEAPSVHLSYFEATTLHEKTKESISEIFIKDKEVEYKYNLKSFFKFYLPIEELREDTYEVETYYVGKFINQRNGEIQPLYLSKEVSILEQDFDDSVMERV